ncbi:hypothetical protein OAA09_00215 [bacterium]|nr:hypothetical protein [bacterium]
MKPYTETILNEGVISRRFSKNVSPDLLIWHQDKHERVVKILEGNGWKFQIDESLPVVLKPGSEFLVPAFTWHRIIKGDSDLILKIQESKKKKQVVHHKNYDAPEGSKRDADLDKARELYKKGNIKGAAKIRQKMEKKARSKPGYKSKRRPDSQKESLRFDIRLNDIIEEVKLDNFLNSLFEKAKNGDELFESEDIIDEKRKRKSGKSPKGLSKAVKKSLDKKADKRCLTRGSVYSEFRKGLSAFLSSGSRKGMSAHQWAHARVNSANPSKKWASVKKRKKCPKKK